jgi:xanthine dehydrogenase small subunit
VKWIAAQDRNDGNRACDAKAAAADRQPQDHAVRGTRFAAGGRAAMTAFTLNGRSVDLAGSEPTETLLRWLGRQGLTGTKEGCADGDCGACTVAVMAPDGNGRMSLQAWNSCLVPLGVLPGRNVVTVEGLAEGEVLHPAQQAMVDCAGSQCGYCTPGFVMSLFAAWHQGRLDDAAIEGNLCRCTGYFPIRRAMAQLAQHEAGNDRLAAALARAQPPAPTALGSFVSPTQIDDAIALKQKYPDAVFVAGATDYAVGLGHRDVEGVAHIALDRIAELARIEITTERVVVGAGAPLDAIAQRLAGVFPALDLMLPWFGGRQVRARATLGGNLGTASPIGDLLPVLLALDAEIHLAGPAGRRSVAGADFFLDYRRTQRAADELITHVVLPRRMASINASYKVSKRATDDISIVAAAFAHECEAGGEVCHVRLAYGGVAPVPIRAREVEAFLIGRRLDPATIKVACARLQATFAPISDHRASADYRRRLAGNLFARYVAEHAP